MNNDTNYISQILSGVAPQGAQRGGRSGGRSSRGRGRGPSHHQSSAGRGSQPAAASDNTAGPSNSSPLSQPSNKSTAKLLHCDTCDAWVPHKPGTWDTHIAGIRHRRQLLSLREHGERGHIVRSVFEKPSLREPRAPSGAGSSNEIDAIELSTEDAVKYGALSTSLLAQVVNMYGANPAQNQYYNTAAQNYRAKALYLEDSRMQEANISQLRSLTMTEGGNFGPAPCFTRGIRAMTVAAGILQHRTFPPSLSLHFAPRQHCTTTVGIWFAALCNFISALADHPAGVEYLIISIPTDFPNRLSHDGWWHIVLALQKLLRSNYTLQRVSIRLSALLVPRNGPNEAALQARIKEILADQEQLREAAAARSADIRLAVLLGAHPRVGRCSILQILPMEAMREIIELAAPRQGCFVEVVERNDISN